MSLKSGISLIVTVFNKEKFIENTLKSIEPQMNKNVQLIIVDDGSTDGTSEKLSTGNTKIKGNTCNERKKCR